MNAHASPIRMCAACRERHPARQLVRFALLDAQLTVDLARTIPGRGVHLCAQPRCLRQAVKRSVFKRGFSQHVEVPVEAGDPALGLCSLVLTAMNEAVGECLVRGERALRSGQRTVEVDVRWPDHGAAGSILRGHVAHRCSARLSWLLASISRFTLNRSGGITRRPESPTPGAG